MKKFYILALLIFTGCSNFEINTAMCDQIASDPHATMPQECRNYVEAEAQKAFDKTKDKQESRENIIKFTKDNDDKED